MTTWNLATDADKIKSISLSKKNYDLTIDVTNNSIISFEADVSGNNLILSFWVEVENGKGKYQDENGNYTIDEKILTIKNYISYTDSVDLKYNENNSINLKEYFDTQGIIFAGDFITQKSQTVKGSALSELIMGGTGKDKLYSNGGNDMFMANSGNDTIYGGKDKNVYVLTGDFGTDTIYLEKTGFNVIAFYDPTIDDPYGDYIGKPLFGENGGLISVTQDDLKSFTRQGNDLVVTVEHEQASGTLILKNYFNLLGSLDTDPVSFLLADKDSGWDNFKNYLNENGYDAETVTAEDFITVMKNANLNDLKSEEKPTISELGDLLNNVKEELLTLGYKNEEEASLNKKAINVTDSLLDETIYGGQGADKITITGGDDYVSAGDGNNTIKVYDNVSASLIMAGDGNNNITIGANSGSFDDALYIEKYEDRFGFYVETSSGNDTIKVGDKASGILIDAGKGKNSVTLGKEVGGCHNFGEEENTYSVCVALSSEGNNTIKIGDDSKGILIDNWSYEEEVSKYGTSTVTVGKNAFFEFGANGSTNNVTVGDGLEYSYIYAENGKNTVSVGKNAKKIFIETYNSNNDTVKIGDNAGNQEDGLISIGLYEGNNSVTIGKNSDNIEVNTGSGNDKIKIGDTCNSAYIDTDKGNDTISVGKDSEHIYINAVGGAKNVVTVGKDSGSFDEEASKKDDTNDAEVFGLIIETGNISSDKITIGDNCNGALINSAEYQGTNDDSVNSSVYGYDTISIGKKAENIYLSTGHGNDKITIGSYAEDIYIEAKDGNDTITVGKGSSNIYVEAGEGNDTIKTSAKNNYFSFDCDYSLGKDTITVSKDSVNTLDFDTYNPDRLFYKYDKNNLVIGYEGDDEDDVSLVTLKNLNTKSYKDTQVNILVNGESYKIDSILYDFSNTKKGQTIKTSDEYAYKGVIGSFGADKIYVSGGETNVITVDSKADTIYANKTDGFDINEDYLYIEGDSKDKLVISGHQSENDLKVFFDVELTPDGHTTGYEVSIYSSNDANGGIRFNYFNNVPSSNLGLIENNGEKLNTSLFNQIASEVANWLGGTEFASASAVLASEDQTAKETLLAYYAQDNLWV